MKINDIIRTRRQTLGLTQEGLADKLGVSAPAVNKWERGLNYPDITLLPALARTLGVDLNTLLSFQEDMSREEIGLFLNKLSETARLKGCAAAFQMARSKVQEFPNNDLLACNIAGLLEGILALYPAGDKEERKGWEQEIVALYERIIHSVDLQVREYATCIVASRCVGKGELERAEALLGQLSDTYKDKNTLTASLREKQGRREEAWSLLEKELLSQGSAIQNILLRMVDLALAEGDQEHAKTFADTASAVGRDLQFSDYAVLSAPLQLALIGKDGPRTLALLEKLLGSLTFPRKLSASPLYRHLPSKESASEHQGMFLQLLFDQLETDPESQFLKDMPSYQELIEKYKKLVLN